jgi:multidrug efflux pump subunit AcrB
VTFLYGVSRFLFSALALAVVLSLFASYLVALTVVPLFCAKLLKGRSMHVQGGKPPESKASGARFHACFNRQFEGILNSYSQLIGLLLKRPVAVVLAFTALFVVSLLIYPLLGVAFFPRTDAGQFVINVKAPSGTRLAVTE